MRLSVKMFLIQRFMNTDNNFFNCKKLLSSFDMINHIKSLETKVPAKVKQQTIKQVCESMKSSIRIPNFHGI